MGIIFEQLSLLFIFMLCGFLLGKFKVVDTGHTKVLSALMVYLFLPCTVFNSFYSNFTVSNLTQYYKLIIISVAVLILLNLFAHITSKLLSKDDYKKKVYKYSLVVPNYGYMGYALAQSLYGTEALLHMVLFALPFTFYIYTFGYCMLTNRKITLKRLINPVIISVLLGAVFGITSLKLPTVLETFVTKSGSCMAPVSMLLAGITISEFDIKNLVNDAKIYLISIIRLVAIPIAVMLVLRIFFDNTVVRAAVILCAMPCGLNTIVFPKLVGEDSREGAKLAFVSSVLSMFSIPAILNLI